MRMNWENLRPLFVRSLTPNSVRISSIQVEDMEYELAMIKDSIV